MRRIPARTSSWSSTRRTLIKGIISRIRDNATDSLSHTYYGFSRHFKSQNALRKDFFHGYVNLSLHSKWKLIDNSKLYYASFLTLPYKTPAWRRDGALLNRKQNVTIINDENTQRKINLQRACRVRIIRAINAPTPLMREHKLRAPFPVACGILRRLNI